MAEIGLRQMFLPRAFISALNLSVTSSESFGSHVDMKVCVAWKTSGSFAINFVPSGDL
jgi:hypothetical protein